MNKIKNVAMIATFLTVKEHNLLKEVNKTINPIIKKVNTINIKRTRLLFKEKSSSINKK